MVVGMHGDVWGWGFMGMHGDVWGPKGVSGLRGRGWPGCLMQGTGTQQGKKKASGWQ